MDNSNKTIKTINIYESFPESWKDLSILETAYKIININLEAPSENEILAIFPDAVVIIYVGVLDYVRFSVDIDFKDKEKNLAFIPEVKDVKKDGSWLIIFTPMLNNQEYEAKKRTASLCGVYLTVNGEGGAYKIEYERVLSPGPVRQFSHAGSAIHNPNVLRKVNMGDETLNLIKKIYNKVHSVESKKKNRLLFSLYWYEKSFRSSMVDAFLHGWIALEALAMPDTTNILPMKKKLAEIFETTTEKIETKFCLGLLVGLRSDIVHNGVIPAIHPSLMDHIHDMYVDLLVHECELEAVYRSKELLTDDSNPIRSLLQKSIK